MEHGRQRQGLHEFHEDKFHDGQLYFLHVLSRNSDQHAVRSMVLTRTIRCSPCYLVNLVHNFARCERVFNRKILRVTENQGRKTGRQKHFSSQVRSLLRDRTLSRIVLYTVRARINGVDSRRHTPGSHEDRVCSVVTLLFFRARGRVDIFHRLSHRLAKPRFAQVGTRTIRRATAQEVSKVASRDVHTDAQGDGKNAERMSPRRRLTRKQPTSITHTSGRSVRKPYSFLSSPQATIRY